MATSNTHTTDAPAHDAGAGDPAPAYFRRLLAQRKLFGALAEAQRSHHGQSSTTASLDSVVNLLTEELEIGFPDLWEPLEADLLVAELGMLHDPAEGPMVGCSICHEDRAQRRAAFPPQPHRRPRHRPATGVVRKPARSRRAA